MSDNGRNISENIEKSNLHKRINYVSILNLNLLYIKNYKQNTNTNDELLQSLLLSCKGFLGTRDIKSSQEKTMIMTQCAREYIMNHD